MKLPSLSKLPSHKRFDFTPRHYDPILEEIEEKSNRAQRIESFKTKKNENLVDIMDAKLERNRRARKKSTHRFVYIIIIMLSLFALTWVWLFKTI